MIPTVIDNYSNKSENFRRHTDPAWLWIVVSTASVSLHLLVFWLMRSTDEFPAWFPQSNQNSIPIDFLEISSEQKSIIKQKSTTPKVKQQSSFSLSPQSSAITDSNQDHSEINSSGNLPQQHKNQKPEVIKPEVLKPEVTKPLIRQQSYPTNATPETTPIIPERELPWNRRQEVILGKETVLPSDIPADSPTPAVEPPLNPNSEPSPTVNQGGAIATITPVLKEEVNELIQQRQIRADGLPDVLAEYKGSTEKELELSSLPGDEIITSANILISLIIDSNGHFQQAKIITIEPEVLSGEISIYEQAINQIFADEMFLAGYNQDGSKPDLSNLYIRLQLKIEPINSQ
ncbi:MAG: hypothetical protein AN487_14280 [Anabaena sp. CRKS33]|jgi:hypothetical protein|nr:MAG: hypothetical protein AN487_14280 [Anabaena sp. CRKS33]